MPLHSTGVGLVLLACAPAPVQDEVLAGDLTLEPEHTQLSGRDLRAQLAAIRRDGVAVASRHHPEAMTSVACPITDQRQGTVAALSVVTRSERLEPAAVRPAVVAVARAISRAVSAAPGPHPER
jgi:DNA-binding IclR family transcriptional regulator